MTSTTSDDLAAARQRIGELERERDAARKYLADAGEEMRARWHAINESLAENRALATQLTVAREALETLRRMAAKPMKSWDAGHVIDARRADEIAEEALEALTPTPTRTGLDEVTEADDECVRCIACRKCVGACDCTGGPQTACTSRETT
jgi:hypothetical protein